MVAARGHPATLTPVHGCQAHPCCHPSSCQAGVGVLARSVVEGCAKCACSILGASGNALAPSLAPFHTLPQKPLHMQCLALRTYILLLSVLSRFVPMPSYGSRHCHSWHEPWQPIPLHEVQALLSFDAIAQLYSLQKATECSAALRALYTGAKLALPVPTDAQQCR